MRTICVLGTRPEAIKMAMLIKKLAASDDIESYVCVTAQHREMLDQVLGFFEITPDYDLNIMKAGQQLNEITGEILMLISRVYDEINPDLVFVHGDTNTCFAATLAAFYKNIKVAHVEAGLRTGNLMAPFPEEGNRLLTTKLATYHFAPTDSNVKNLKAENVKAENIIKTGNTVIDSLLFASEKVQGFSPTVHQLTDEMLRGKKIILVTGHRRENFGKGLQDICSALKEIAEKYSDILIIYPVHLNPRVKKPVMELLNNIENILLTDPLAYPDFIYLMKRAWVILTDSGGIQEEGPSLGVPVLVMRDVTERPEAIDAGTVQLVGTDRENIVAGIKELIDNPLHFKKMSQARNPYGDGKATDRILRWLHANRENILEKGIA